MPPKIKIAILFAVLATVLFKISSDSGFPKPAVSQTSFDTPTISEPVPDRVVSEPQSTTDLVSEKPQLEHAPASTGPVLVFDSELKSAPATVPKIQFPEGAKLVIPSIGINAPIRPVGLTTQGNMDVLNSPTDVGWYQYGTAPGSVGSAVIGAHVFQVFSTLKNIKLGDEVGVDQGGGRLRFVVSEIEIYDYEDPKPLDKVFNRKDGEWLALITCHGQFLSSRGTYQHRLVVYAKLQK